MEMICQTWVYINNSYYGSKIPLNTFDEIPLTGQHCIKQFNSLINSAASNSNTTYERDGFLSPKKSLKTIIHISPQSVYYNIVQTYQTLGVYFCCFCFLAGRCVDFTPCSHFKKHCKRSIQPVCRETLELCALSALYIVMHVLLQNPLK